MLEIVTHSEKETIQLGTRIARLLRPGDIVCLFGSLGAGKTILVKGMAKGLNIDKDEVISPSFVLIREYHAAASGSKRHIKKARYNIPLYHFDLYRLNSPRAILNLGYEEYLYGQGISVIEWAERMDGFLPVESLDIKLVIKADSERMIRITSKGQRYRALLRRFKKS